MDLGTHESRAIPIGRVRAPALPSRSEMDDQKLDELTEDIRARGIIQHLIVFPVGDEYEIVAGHRRYTAARRAGLAVVPCDVYPSREAADEGMQFAENQYREKLNPADEAEWFDLLLTTKCNNDVDALCARLKVRRDTVERRLDLIYRGHADVFVALKRKQIIVGVAEVLNKCSDDAHRANMLDQAIHDGWTIARAQGQLDWWKQIMRPAVGAEPAPSSTTSGITPANDYFKCQFCGESHDAENMRPKQQHDYCERAILRPALELWTHRADYLRAPRTLDEAADLVSELLERFPALAGDSAPAGATARP